MTNENWFKPLTTHLFRFADAKYQSGRWWLLTLCDRFTTPATPDRLIISAGVIRPTRDCPACHAADQADATTYEVITDGACRLTPHSRQELAKAREPVRAGGTPPSDLETARRVWVQLTQGRGGALGSKTGWRDYRAGFSTARVLTGYADRLAPIASRLANVSIENVDALKVIADYARHPDALFVCDPPYPIGVRTSPARYRTECGEGHHGRLATTLQAVAGKAVVFTYPNRTYDLLYADWTRIEFAATKQSGAAATEIAYLNYPPPTEPSLLDFLDP